MTFVGAIHRAKNQTHKTRVSFALHKCLLTFASSILDA